MKQDKAISIALLGIVLITHYGYGGATEKEASYLFYIFRGMEGVALFSLAFRFSKNPIWIMACLIGLFEESQTAVCGMAALGDKPDVPLWSGLCVVEFGYWPYAVALAAVLVFLWGKYAKP